MRRDDDTEGAATGSANASSFDAILEVCRRLRQENAYLREEVLATLGMGPLIGESPGLINVRQQIEIASPADASVLVTGEIGTGKTLVARVIHGRGPRSGRALITVNCRAGPGGRREGGLFDHVRHAIAGGDENEPGRFELAGGSTLFLDEVGELPLGMQAKLLRALQRHGPEHPGDGTRPFDARVIAGSSRNLRQEAEAGRFRLDLFHWLSVVPIDIPPLRERRSDIPPLTAHFVEETAWRMKRPSTRVPQAAMRRLVAYDWPGNVRELQNTIESAFVLARGGAPWFVPHREVSPSRARSRR